jgi:hypothetical protein
MANLESFPAPVVGSRYSDDFLNFAVRSVRVFAENDVSSVGDVAHRDESVAAVQPGNVVHQMVVRHVVAVEWIKPECLH